MSGRKAPRAGASTVTTGPTRGPAGLSRSLRRRIWMADDAEADGLPHTTHALSAPVASRAVAIDAGQLPLPVPQRRRPSDITPVVVVCQEPPDGLRQASWMPWPLRP